MRNRVAACIATLAAGLCASYFFCAAAQAHPHVWVSYDVELQMHQNRVDAVAEKWIFAQGFPVSLLIDPTHLPKAGPLADADVAACKAQAFDSLRQAGYFTHLYADNRTVPLGAPEHFTVAVENGKIVYTFILPLRQPLDTARAPLEVGIWDDSFFADYEPLKASGVRFGADASANCKASGFKDGAHPIFGGAMLPLASRVSC